MRTQVKNQIIALLIAICLFGCQQKKGYQNMEDKFTLVIHGGAGTILKKNMTPEREQAYKEILQESLLIGYAILKDGGSSIDAVEAAVKVMEDSPIFNAGKGAVFTHDGKNEMDASIMDGKTLNAGAVSSVTCIKNPIQLARTVMEKSPHVMLTGDGAEQFAKENGFEFVDSSYFHTDFRWNQLEKVRESDLSQLDHSENIGEDNSIYEEIQNEKKFGTVGAVALDKHGNLAAATSTGGMTNKQFGRVGDSPIIGSGTYANNNTCAVSCTGHGEYFMRGVVAYDISALMEYNDKPIEAAANEVIMKKQVELGGEGGIIAVDKDGNIALTFNSAGMYRGFVKADGNTQVYIYK